jgi:uncharacterized membrane protein YkvA (DUF1232 family)
MEIRERLRQMVRSFSTEVLSLLFVFLDRRVRWFTKVLLLLPIAYVVSPIDIIRDSIFFWGQADDLAVLRMSHYLFTRFLHPAVLSDNRQRAAAFLEAGRANRAAFYLALAAVWGITILLVLQWLLKRLIHNV